MENLNYINSISGISHTLSFIETSHSPGKLVIKSDGRSIGKINKKSGVVFCNNKEIAELIYSAVLRNG